MNTILGFLIFNWDASDEVEDFQHYKDRATLEIDCEKIVDDTRHIKTVLI